MALLHCWHDLFLIYVHALFGIVVNDIGRHPWISSVEGAGQSGVQGEQLRNGQVLLLHCHGCHTGESTAPGNVRQLRSNLG